MWSEKENGVVDIALQNTLAYGTTYTTDDDAYVSVSKALDTGYRIINTCAAYKNERGMGRAIARIPREELTIVSLDSNSRRSSEDPSKVDGYRTMLAQIYDSLENLSVSYIDYYLIHWPVPRYMEQMWQQLNADSWRAMEDCVEKGLIRHIGVSNFLPYHLKKLKETARLPVEVNQLEIHPSFQQRATVQFCKEQGMQVMAWSPLFKGKSVSIPQIISLAREYGKTPAQIILRWDIQQGIIPVVCSSREERMKSNIDIFHFELSTEDMAVIDSLEIGEHVDVFSYKRQLESLEKQ